MFDGGGEVSGESASLARVLGDFGGGCGVDVSLLCGVSVSVLAVLLVPVACRVAAVVFGRGERDLGVV